MRWRFVDRIEEFQPWVSIKGLKAVSLAEYSLLNPFGREGAFPESLVLESCVHLARWLIIRSSDFKKTCLLSGLESFNFDREVGPGDILRMGITVSIGGEDSLRIDCKATDGERPIGYGTLTVEMMDIAVLADPEAMKALWKELYVKA